MVALRLKNRQIVGCAGGGRARRRTRRDGGEPPGDGGTVRRRASVGETQMAHASSERPGSSSASKRARLALADTPVTRTPVEPSVDAGSSTAVEDGSSLRPEGAAVKMEIEAFRVGRRGGWMR